MTALAEHFNDPFDPPRSLQLNNRYWKDEKFQNLDMLREAEDDLRSRRVGAMRRSLRHAKNLLPEHVRNTFLSRLLYSVVYSVFFEPIHLSLKLSDAFVSANRYSGPKDQIEMAAPRTDELKYVIDLVHNIYRDHYGIDILSSSFSVRFIRANEASVQRATRDGPFSDFHFDEGKDFTCIIYLSRVVPENGCFTYVDGSNAVPKSHVLRALHQVVDNDLRLATPEQRALLPLEARGSLCLGTYLDDEKRKAVQEAAVPFVGDVGDAIIFNGFGTLHRGGQPLVGERTALFIATRGYVNARAKKAFYDLLARLWL
jgi:phytanoyl-CoA dioxygenase PhyH